MKNNQRRLKEYDYSHTGFYFVTFNICNRVCKLGKVINGIIELNNIGEIVCATINQMDRLFKAFTIDCYSIMPDHIRLLVFIDNPIGSNEKSKKNSISPNKNHLGRFVGAIKTRSTILVKKNMNINIDKLWQKSYYDRIVRNEIELNNIRNYILQNSLKWELNRKD